MKDKSTIMQFIINDTFVDLSSFELTRTTTTRVRQLTPLLTYGDLTRRKLLPKKPLFTRSEVPTHGKNFPLARKMGYSQHGLFVEELVKAVILGGSTAKVFASLACAREKLTPYREIMELAASHFEGVRCDFGVEMEVDGIQGHPDICTDGVVYDVKTSGRFAAMRSDTILQVLSYFALCKLSGKYPEVHSVGLVLPCQGLIVVRRLDGWDYKAFWNEMVSAKSVHFSKQNLNTLNSSFISKLQLVGTHIEKKSLINAISSNSHSALQFFVAGRNNTNISVNETFTRRLKRATATSLTPVFIHAPYTLNLSNPQGNNPREGDDPEFPWTLSKTRDLLDYQLECNLAGVVIHVGRRRVRKRGDLPATSEEDAVATMKRSIELIAAKYADSPRKPNLLIETPAGAACEVLTDLQDFVEFYLTLSPEARGCTTVCVDTCHVFAAGYNPSDYLEALFLAEVPVTLVHYNDSKYAKGTRKDRHAKPGTGFIGVKEMERTLDIIESKTIPSVFE